MRHQSCCNRPNESLRKGSNHRNHQGEQWRQDQHSNELIPFSSFIILQKMRKERNANRHRETLTWYTLMLSRNLTLQTYSSKLLCKIDLQNLKSAWRSNLITRGSSSRAHTKFKFIQDAETRTSCPCFCLAFVLFQEPGVPHHELRMQKLKKAIHVLSWFLLILTTEPPKKAHLFNIFPMPKKENEKPVLNLLFQTFIPCHQFCWDHPVVLLSRACNFIITSTFSEVITSYPSYPPTVSSSFTFSSFSSIRTTTSNLDLSSESCLHCLQPNTCISFLYCKQNNLKKRISLCYCFLIL